jgi:hypothetical protein
LNNLCSAILLSILVAWAGTAFAATVVIVRPPSPSPRVTETITFLHGELSSVGLEDAMSERPAAEGAEGIDPRAWMERLAAERGAIAVIDIVGDDTVTAVDVWVLKSPGRFEVTRVAVDPDNANSSVRLAIRALEALRASLVEVEFAARYRPSQPTPSPPTVTPPRGSGTPDKAMSHREHIGLEVGATALMSLDGVGPAVLPVIRADWAARSWLVVQAAIAGLGTRAKVTTSEGSARVGQEFAVLGGCYRLWPDARWWPYFSLATGVLHTSLEGESVRGKRGNGDGQWSLLGDAGFGAGMRLYRSYYLTLSGHVQVAHPYIAVHFGDPVVATTGRPNLHFDLTVGAWL